MAGPADEKIARENRLRLFRDEAERAMKEVAEQGVSVRKNMARLRKLRLAKEAEAASATQAASPSPAKRSVK
jgi:hypothetical protein